MGSARQAELINQATQEMNTRLSEVFGAGATIESALLAMQASPSDYEDGQWGFSHAGLAVAAMQASWTLTGDVSAVEQAQEQQLAYWYTRESIARCNKQDADDYLNPLTWSEDSRLDYMSAVLFTNWYLSQVD